MDADDVTAYIGDALARKVNSNGGTIIVLPGGVVHMSQYNFGGVFGGDVNIVENGNLFNAAVDQTAVSGEVRSLLKQIRDASDGSADLADGDKQAVAAQLAGILAELRKGDKAEKSRLQKAIDVIKTIASGAKPVLELAIALSPLLLAAV
jgi:hypothetical protein